MAIANPVIALLMALCMLLSPITYEDGTTAELTPLTVTIESVDGLSISGGLNKTADGQPVIYFDSNGIGFAMTNDAGYVSDGSATYAVPAEELYRLVGSAMSMPEPTEDDATALTMFLSGVMSQISYKSINYTATNRGFSLSFDVDQLAHELHTAVPTVLNTYAAYLDPTLAKYAPVLIGESVTSAQLAELWPQLGLDQVNTGLSLSLTAMQNGDTLTLIGSVAEVNFLITLSDSGFALSVTTNGVTYAFDTADVITLAQLLAQLQLYITEDAFSFEQTAESTDLHSYTSLVTTTMKVDTEALSADLNRGLAEIIAQNAATVDALLDKYRSWIALADQTLAEQLSAASLSQAFTNGLIALPAATGELVVVVDQYLGTTTVDGYFANLTLQGKAYSNYYQETGSFILTVADRYDPIILSLNYRTDTYDGYTATLSANEPLFDLFHTLTISSVDEGGDFSWHLTTDTNVLRVGYSDEEQYAEIKVGPVNAKLHVDEEDFTHLEFYSPVFFADLHTDGNNINLDTTFGGFDLAESSYGNWTFNGYWGDNHYRRNTLGLNFNEWSENFDAYLNTLDGESIRALLDDDVLTIYSGNDVYTIALIESGASNAVSYTIAQNGVIGATLLLIDCDTAIIAELYQGTDTTVTPYYRLILNTAPEAFAAPADAIVVDAMTFLQKVEALF